MVLQQEVTPTFPSNVPVYLTSYARCRTEVLVLEPFLNFKHNGLPAENHPRLQKNTLVLLQQKDEGILNHKGMFTQSDFVDGFVVIPAIPVVWIFLRSNLAP